MKDNCATDICGVRRSVYGALLACLCIGACGRLSDASDETTSVQVDDNQSSTTPKVPGTTQPSVNNFVTTTLGSATTLSGAPTNGFSLQAIDNHSLCLASNSAIPRQGATFQFGTCANTPNQLFYWYLGGLAQGPNLCMTASDAQQGPVTLQGCPSIVPSSLYPQTRSYGLWVLSSDSNVLYHNVPDGKTWTVTTSGSLANGVAVVATPYAQVSDAIALVKTTSFAGPVKIYANDLNDLCLTEANGAISMTKCTVTNSNQAFNFLGASIKAPSGLCVAVTSATTDTALTITTCDTSNTLQRWYLAGSIIGLEGSSPYPKTGALSIEFSPSTSPATPILKDMSNAKAPFSIGARSF